MSYSLKTGRIKLGHPAAFALLKGSIAIIHDAVKDHPDREALRADQDGLIAAMDTPALERLLHCMDALNAGVDLLRKKPRKPAGPVEKRGARGNGNGQAGTGDGA